MKKIFTLPNYSLCPDGIYRPDIKIAHRTSEYDENGFFEIEKMQDEHFWYRGRHDFLLNSLNYFLDASAKELRGIDLGGGCGGWLKFLKRKSTKFSDLALADSSEIALDFASSALPSSVLRIQVDLMRLKMNSIWNVAFLLDVIEHLPDDLGALENAARALKPGGVLFITAPALKEFWSYNDDVAQHLRRYSKNDLRILAERAGLRVKDLRYFMFLLSPVYYLSRLGRSRLSHHQKVLDAKKGNSVPSPMVNEFLGGIFHLENKFNRRIMLPWGTSILAVLQKK